MRVLSTTAYGLCFDYVAASEAQKRIVCAEQSLRRAAAEQIGQTSPTVNPMSVGEGFESGRSLRWHVLDWQCGIETEYKYDYLKQAQTAKGFDERLCQADVKESLCQQQEWGAILSSLKAWFEKLHFY